MRSLKVEEPSEREDVVQREMKRRDGHDRYTPTRARSHSVQGRAGGRSELELDNLWNYEPTGRSFAGFAPFGPTLAHAARARARWSFRNILKYIDSALTFMTIRARVR